MTPHSENKLFKKKIKKTKSCKNPMRKKVGRKDIWIRRLFQFKKVGEERYMDKKTFPVQKVG